MFKYLACIAMILMNGATALAADAADEFAEAALKPFWRATQLRESMFFIQAKATERPQSALLFTPKKIISVTSATREVVFEAEKDFVVDQATGVIRLPEGSRIAFKTLDEMYPLMTSNSPKIGRQGGDKTRGIFFDNADGYHKLQVEVTYEMEAGQWKGEVPAYAGDALPNTMKKLRAGEPIKLVMCGDSISAGYNASKYTKAKPGCPAYGELVALAIEKKFGGKVTFENYAVGGWSAGRGLQHATEKKLGEGKPDVVIIAFGMNDVFQRNASAYQKNIRSIMEVIRKDSPATEFILVASMLGNAEWGMPMEQFPLYLKALKELTGPGVVLADLTTLWGDLLKRKSFYDLCGNGVNHPNDFGHQIYAQVVMALLTPAAEKAKAAIEPVSIFAKDARILFQGDSITDGNRGRSADPNHILGHGYVFIIAAQHGAAFPQQNLNFMNRGISGNKASELEKRWQKETIDLKPDVLSILVGINDARSVPVEEYEKTYDKLLADARAANPKLRLVLCEPFLLPGEKKDAAMEARMLVVREQQAIVAKLAKKHDAALVLYQRMFEEACMKAPATYWIWDAVHPTYSGHQLMADQWLRSVREKWPAGAQ